MGSPGLKWPYEVTFGSPGFGSSGQSVAFEWQEPSLLHCFNLQSPPAVPGALNSGHQAPQREMPRSLQALQKHTFFLDAASFNPFSQKGTEWKPYTPLRVGPSALWSRSTSDRLAHGVAFATGCRDSGWDVPPYTNSLRVFEMWHACKDPGTSNFEGLRF